MKKPQEKLKEDLARVFSQQSEFERWRRTFQQYSATETLGIKLHEMSTEDLQKRYKDADQLWEMLEDIARRLRQQIQEGQAIFTAEFTGFLADILVYLPTLALEQQALERTLTNRRLYGHTRWLDDKSPTRFE